MTEPFLKWAGGKRWLANSNQLPRPATFERYIEPFLGGAAIFFHLRPEQAILSDINSELIELYCVIRDHPEDLMGLMRTHHDAHSQDYYYEVRASIPEAAIERAARTMYLNRTCWNGLYRVNLKGVFNVPIGTKSTVVFDHDDFAGISERLRAAEIRCCDFEETVSEAQQGDFLFVDPPYTVRHNMNGFIKYNENLFSWNDQIRLRDAVADAIERGAAVVVTNADHDSVRELYEDVCDYRSVARASVLASETARRGQTTEALFSANI
ncbi:DNA adenine methylase [Sphingomonas sp. LH128]|uniref:DNA adenine methylase n=1 Tax=Sphingomonas sp. LH128 TaxID=473781 RepID=UPI00027CB1E6|nr:Dam family site-specific DNA-(adenine-N6)-methyltransferase [Sphingomonas sp. LH128]EJU12115.1 DNA adenine methylase [Sphingomonas sp. LH128]